MSVAVFFGLISAILFALAGIFAILAPPPPALGRVHLVAWGAFFLVLYFLAGGGTLALGG